MRPSNRRAVPTNRRKIKKWANKGGQARGIHSKSMPIFEEAAAILGMDKETLKQSLKDKTLAQLAAEKKISEADLIAKLQAERTKKNR